MKYPLATGDSIHCRPPDGAELIWMTPEYFLEECPPLRIEDEEEDAYILALVEHIRDQRPLDAPELFMMSWCHRGHDGRHRATAARIAGVTRLPVYVTANYSFFHHVPAASRVDA